MRPAPGQTICDPACGTGGFLLAAHDFITSHHQLDRDASRFLSDEALHGWEIVDNTARLCMMNLYLHGVGVAGDEQLPVRVGRQPAERPRRALRSGAVESAVRAQEQRHLRGRGRQEESDALSVGRDDFWATTSNKQLNFVQHIRTLLTIGGRAAVVVPDNVLFEGGAGETVRRKLLQTCDVHTLLRLPTGSSTRRG